ncbi:UNVERIFIED_CONTAM: hypothetical protein Sangu_1271100 [Sesamum angustifolium]|uniref:Uncharacterized protein n=1 Tax=Sesamum angustifolium TaxID=2727405 RepID=A0AAW2NK77_9LAMI
MATSPGAGRKGHPPPHLAVFPLCRHGPLKRRSSARQAAMLVAFHAAARHLESRESRAHSRLCRGRSVFQIVVALLFDPAIRHYQTP